ncbi:MAG: Phage XkdN-like protein [Pelotomaculum sp. PtaB.Bin104]|nr:MAG: Phage XkdN-like protein [Pelotomaculum sp. PtaB.Bin104]
MGQTLDMLLAANPTKIKEIPTGKIEIPRLSKQLGQPFYITFRAATIDEMNNIGDKANKSESEEMKWTIYELAIDPAFKTKELREKYGTTRPVDIVSTILLGGEILMVYNAIMRISGFDKGGIIEEVKN